MSRIIWESVAVDNIYYLGFLNGIKNNKVIYQLFNKEVSNDETIFLLYHYEFMNNNFSSYELIKSETIKRKDDIAENTIYILQKIREFQNFVNFFERRKKISKLVA